MAGSGTRRIEAIVAAALELDTVRGLITEMAAKFGVHRTTVWRDIRKLSPTPLRYDVTKNGQLMFVV